jgi:predicted RNase H-like nuclease (RuvC/YqgF family)
MTEKNIEEMNSAELKAELEGRPDLGNILRGDPVNVPAGEQENKTDEPAETTTNEGSADTSQVTPPKEETPEEVQDKKSKFEKYAEKKNRELQEKDEVITTKEERIKELEAQLKEKEESEDFESIEEKENAINEIKNDLHYEKNRTSELKSEKSALEKRKLDGLMDTMDIIPDEQSKIREMRKNPTYANLPAEDLIALYSAKNG